MVKKEMYVNVNFEKEIKYTPITFVKNDYNSNKIIFNTLQDITGLLVFVAFELSDGTKYLLQATNVSSNKAELDLPTGVLSVTGEVEGQVALYEDTSSRLTSYAKFKFDVVNDLSDEAVETSDNVPILTQLTSDIADLKVDVAENTNSINDIIEAMPAYGLRWNQTQDTYERLGGSIGLTIDNTVNPHVSDFDNIYPWSERKRVVIDGNVMVRIPKFYYRSRVYIDGTDTIKEWWISRYQKDSSYKLHENFDRAGQIKDAIYVAAHEGYNDGGVLKSIPSVQPTVSQTIGTFRTQANSNGVGWALEDLLSISADQLMYFIEYASFFSQSKLGIGIINLDIGTGNHSQNTGHTDTLGNGSGEVILGALENGATGPAETYPVQYRGKENPFGNVYEWKDGFIIKDDGYYIEDDITNHNDTAAGYTHIPAAPIYGDGYADDIEDLSAFEYAFMPNSTAGSSSTYLTDFFYSHDAGEVNVAHFGGFWNNGSDAGLFLWSLNRVASNASRFIGARLMYIPEGSDI